MFTFDFVKDLGDTALSSHIISKDAQTTTMSLQSNIKLQQAFQFRAGFTSCLVFELIQYDLALIDKQLIATTQKAPDFFRGSGVVIDLCKLNSHVIIEFNHLITLLKKYGITPIGIYGGTPAQQNLAHTFHLPLLNLSRTINKETQTTTTGNHTKLVTQPIRSGMQIYAKNGDLIITGQVSSGAELLADGHIHIYGCLRGRALAGINGNESARIFCRALDAELISIAGYYLTREEYASLTFAENSLLQIYLENDKLKIEPL